MGESDGSRKQLGKILLQQKLVSAGELQEMLEEQRRDPGHRLASAAARAGRLSMQQALEALAKQHDVAPIDLSIVVVPLSLLTLIPEEIAREHLVFPLRAEGESLRLAMASPDRGEVIEEVEFLTAKKVVPYVALGDVLTEVIDYAYDADRRGLAFYIGAFATDDSLGDAHGQAERAPEPLRAKPESGRKRSNAWSSAETRAPHAEDELDEAFQPQPRSSAPPPMPPPDPSARVLLADADDGARAALCAALTELGVNVSESRDGVETLERVRDDGPRLLVVDLELPSVRGLDICRRLRASPRFESLAIAVVTGPGAGGWRLGEDLRENFGVEHVFEKPLDGPQVARVLRLLLEGQRPPSEPPPLSEASQVRRDAAMAAFEKGDLNAAIAALADAADADPGAFELRYHLGLLHGRRDDLFGAIAALEAAIALQPRHFAALKNLAVVYQRAGFRHSAHGIWQRALCCVDDEQTRQTIKEHMASLL